MSTQTAHIRVGVLHVLFENNTCRPPLGLHTIFFIRQCVGDISLLVSLLLVEKQVKATKACCRFACMHIERVSM